MHAGTGYDREDPWHGYVRVLLKDTGALRQAIQRRYKNRGRRYGIFLLAGLVADPNYSTYLRTTRIDKDLRARAVKSDLLLEERRIDVAAELSERDSSMATRRQWKPKQQYKDGARPRIRDPHDQRCYKCGKMGHISYQC